MPAADHASGSGLDVDVLPLVVDVDGTLIRGDLLHEAALQFVATRPFESWKLAVWLARGKAHLKSELAARIDPGVDNMPLRDETVAVIADAVTDGRPVYLASASDHRWVEPIAERINGIAGVMASDGEINLAGTAKAEALVARFGEKGFDYVGDARVDMPVWTAARRALLVSHAARFERGVRRRFPDMITVADARPQPRSYLQALRPHQWAKNALVFLPVIAGHKLGDPLTLWLALLAFAAFSLAASSAYILNDLLDIPGDRDHPRKRNRPFAAGRIPVIHGIALSAALMAAALGVGMMLTSRFATVLVCYVILTLAYSLVLKRKLLIDVIVLGGLYTIRVLGGVAASGEQQSQWLLMFSLFLFLSLATVKRCSELVARRDAGKPAPPGRGYAIGDLAVLFPLAAAAGYAAVLIVTLYLSSPEVALLYAHPFRMWLICPLLLYWISRVLVLASRGEMHDDPVIFALTDRVSWLTGALGAGIIVASI
jgi:4-hydroxybenzoate polyprenyltransferase/phosphoserine phosphatase